MRLTIRPAMLVIGFACGLFLSTLVTTHTACTQSQANDAQKTLAKVEAATQNAHDVAVTVQPAVPAPASSATQAIELLLLLGLAAEKAVGKYIIPALTKKDGTLPSNSGSVPETVKPTL